MDAVSAQGGGGVADGGGTDGVWHRLWGVVARCSTFFVFSGDVTLCRAHHGGLLDGAQRLLDK